MQVDDVSFLGRRALLAAGLSAMGGACAADAPAPAAAPAVGRIDGEPPSVGDLRAMALANYGHFSTMRIRRRSVQGLDFQLARLDRSTRLLFGSELDGERVRRLVREAVPDDDRTWLVRINVFPRVAGFADLTRPMPAGVFVTQSPLAAEAPPPRAVRSVQHERVLPDVKHVGTFGLFHHRKLAQAAGFDDALFLDARRSISEGSTWNVGFYDGRRVVLPTAPALPGGAIHLLRLGMRSHGIPFVERDIRIDEIKDFELAFWTNVPDTVRPLRRIDATEFSLSHPLHERLKACYESNEWTAL